MRQFTFALAGLRRCLPLLVLAVLGGGSIGCAAGTKQLTTARYTLSHPDYWKVKAVAQKDGEPTVVIVSQYGDAVIDEGSGSLQERDASYDTVTADVEVRVYSWADPGTGGDPTEQVAKLLATDREVALASQHVVSETPPECNLFKKKYTLLGTQQLPLDLLSRPGYRSILVGGRANGALIAALARVEYQQDVGRYCHDLRNMQVQLQNLLDGLAATGGGKPAATSQSQP